jgi:hypothetical protein
MRYKAIAAVLGAASLLAMGTTAAEESAKSSYSIDGASTTVTGPGPNHDARRVVYAGRQGGTTLRIHDSVRLLIGSVPACARRHNAMAIWFATATRDNAPINNVHNMIPALGFACF